MTRATGAIVAAFCVLPLMLRAQTPQAIPIDREPHHHFVLQNDAARTYAFELGPRESVPMIRHQNDEVSVILGPATTVSTTPGQADVLTMSKTADIIFTPAGLVHSVRNIGQTAYRMTTIELLHPQTGDSKICGSPLAGLKTECRVIQASDATSLRADLPQFETDETQVTLHTFGPHQGANFGEADQDLLLVAMDEMGIAPSGSKGADQTLAPGKPIWIARGSAMQLLTNRSDKEALVVIVAFAH